MENDPNIRLLQEPIEFEGETITRITVHPLKAKDVIQAEKELRAIKKQRGETVEADQVFGGSMMEVAALLMAKSFRLPPEAVEEMSGKDFFPLMNEIVGFLS